MEVSQDETNQVEEEESPQVESAPVEEIPSNDSDEEETVQPQSNETEPEITEEVEEDLVIEETPLVEETVQEKYDRSLKKTRTGFGARLIEVEQLLPHHYHLKGFLQQEPIPLEDFLPLQFDLVHLEKLQLRQQAQ